MSDPGGMPSNSHRCHTALDAKALTRVTSPARLSATR